LVPGSNELRKTIYGDDVWEKAIGIKNYYDALEKWNAVKSTWTDISRNATPM
jgi:hypothetical protein